MTKRILLSHVILPWFMKVLYFQTGLVVMGEQPWLCCSPDGVTKVNNITAVVEVKCPHRCKDTVVVDYEARTSNVEYLKFVDDQLVLHRNHSYFTQLQLQMYVLNVPRGFFFVYSAKQTVTLEVTRDDSFLAEVVPKLEFFYFTYLLCELTKTDLK